MKAILLDEAKKWLEENFENQYTRMAVFGIMQSMSTVDYQKTPNEPLTCKELKEMAGKPVYVVEPKEGISRWMLIDMVDEKSIWCVVAIGWTYRAFHKTYGKTWLAYRRPPEGEEET